MPAGIRVVLVRPRRGGNVGAVARAMKNTGLAELVVVAPRTPVGRVGERMAAHAGDVLARRQTVATLADALDDCQLAVGTVGRTTTGPDVPLAPREAAPRILAAARRGPVALVFGPEDHGLANAELGRCQLLVRIPAAAAYPSFNLAQAVLVLGYELLLVREVATADRRSRRRAAESRARSPAPEAHVRGTSARRRQGPGRDSRPATSREREALIAHLAEALARIGFLSRQNPDHILRDVRSLLARAGLTTRDVQIWRGIARQVLWAAGAATPRGDRPSRRVKAQ